MWLSAKIWLLYYTSDPSKRSEVRSTQSGGIIVPLLFTLLLLLYYREFVPFYVQLGLERHYRMCTDDLLISPVPTVGVTASTSGAPYRGVTFSKRKTTPIHRMQVTMQRRSWVDFCSLFRNCVHVNRPVTVLHLLMSSSSFSIKQRGKPYWSLSFPQGYIYL